MPALSRLIPAIVATALLATACGGASSDDGAQSTNTETADGQTSTFEHALGTSEIPTAPERVVTGVNSQ